MNVRILSVAEVDATEAAIYYEERQSGLGDQFLTEFERALGRIRRDPGMLGVVEDYTGLHELRRCLLRRFPCIVIVQVLFDEAVVIAVCDARRRPFYWLERLN